MCLLFPWIYTTAFETVTLEPGMHTQPGKLDLSTLEIIVIVLNLAVKSN